MTEYYPNEHTHWTKMYMYIHQVTFLHKECVTFFVLLDFFKNVFSEHVKYYSLARVC